MSAPPTCTHGAGVSAPLATRKQCNPPRNYTAFLRREARLTSGLQRPRVQRCGRYALPAHAPMLLEGPAGPAFGGLEVCGSAWECPVCAYRVRAKHAAELVRVAREHRAAGGHVYLLTLTLAHGWGDDLRRLRTGLADAWRRLVRGAPWNRWAERVGWVGYARAMEVTHGTNGWHPHLHALVCTEHAITPAAARALAERWRDAVVREIGGKHAPDVFTELKCSKRVVLFTRGVRLETTADGDTAARYLAKLGLEVSGAGKSAGRSQWTLLERATATEDPRATMLWLDYCEAMRGARTLTWSRKLRARYAVETEDDPAPKGRCTLVFSGRAWSLIRERDWQVAEVAREGGARAVLAWVRARDPCAAAETERLSFLALGDHTSLAP